MKSNVRELINGAIDRFNRETADWYSPDEETGFVPTASAPAVWHIYGYVQALEDIGAISSVERINIYSVIRGFERGGMPHVTSSGNAERRRKE